MSHVRKTIICVCMMIFVATSFSFASTDKNNEVNNKVDEETYNILQPKIIIETEDLKINQENNYENTYTHEETTENDNEKEENLEYSEVVVKTKNKKDKTIKEEKIKKETKEETKKVEEIVNFVEYNISNNNGFKSYMPYTAITCKSSPQYKLQQQCYTGLYGIRVNNEGRYCIAIGTAFNAAIGTYIDLILENGIIIECIVADIKDPAHTKQDNITTKANGCVSEFIVDTKNLHKTAKKMGDISYCSNEWNSKVVKFKIYE